MPLNLDAKCLAALKPRLAEKLETLEVIWGNMLSPYFDLGDVESVLPKTGQVKERILELLGDAAVADFINGKLSREVAEVRNAGREPNFAPLQSIPEYADLGAVAERLAAEFNSLPWKYAVSLPLPKDFSAVICMQEQSVVELSKSVTIRTGIAANELFPLISGIEKRDGILSGRVNSLLNSLFIPVSPEWAKDRAYIQIEVEGFIGRFLDASIAFSDAVSSIKAFLGLGVALLLFEFRTSFFSDTSNDKIYVHRFVGDKWTIEDAHQMSGALAEGVRCIHNFDAALDAKPGARTAWTKNRLDHISAAFAAGKRATNLRLASHWYFDSHCGTDELLQFVQAAVVVEILLGDKLASDQTGLGELLANRCAYLIATTHSQRDEILSDFRAIYKVRSKIVHNGKSRLSREDRKLFYKLRWIGQRIIQEEVDLLVKDRKQAKAAD
jgi:hypothetical protein